MRTFKVQNYNASGVTAPSSQAGFKSVIDTYKKLSLLSSEGYAKDNTINIGDFTHLGTSSLSIITGTLFIDKFGSYQLQILVTGGSFQVYRGNTLVLESYLNNTNYDLTLTGEPLTIIYVGSTTGTLNIRWIEPLGGSIFSPIPFKNLPVLGLIQFPFTAYDSIQEGINKDYLINGETFQKRVVTNPHQPYKTFEVTLKQDNVYDRLKLRIWFDLVVGKKYPFAFSSRKGELTLTDAVGPSDSILKVRSSNFTDSLPILKRMIYIERINFIAQIIDVIGFVDPTYGPCEEIFLDERLPEGILKCEEIQFIYLCRLDTDTLSYELQDIDSSSVTLSLYELYNDNSLVYV